LRNGDQPIYLTPDPLHFDGEGNLAQSRLDYPDYLVYIFQELVIVEAQNSAAEVLQQSSPLLVFRNLLLVNRSIDLDNEICLRAVKVDDKATYRVLAASLKTAKPFRS
jgi:hypothetical protein